MKHSMTVLAIAAAICMISGPVSASDKPKAPTPIKAEIDDAVIDQARGADQSVDYASLRKFGPWDDRNYDLTAADIALLPANDRYLHNVPAFFKVLKRKEGIAEGRPLLFEIYPREIDKEFAFRFGGLLQNGVLNRRGLGIYSHPDPQNPPKAMQWATDPLPNAPVEGEGPMAGDNETGIEYNPANPNLVIAGSNGPGGQIMNYSSDGGVTWSTAGALPSTCCDPASDWSSDGTVAYTASLGSGFGSGFRTVVYRSTNNGQTWGPAVRVSNASSDKEYIHVDHSATSPYRDYVYATWHESNVMMFSRSTDLGVTFSTPLAFSSDERGIGSDITTDASGRIYYAWPSITSGSAEIWVKTSTDGGATFGPAVMAYDLRGRFDFAIPSMESRRAFIYISAGVDQSGGPHNGRVYLAFTDEAPNSPGNGSGSASATHGWIQVVYSDNQGATWQVAATPHAVADQATVDRFHPWLDVDATGNVHLGFYDTRNSTNRTGVDFYYVVSADGGASWTEETRVSAAASVNITNGQEWGDYNGLSVSTANRVAMSWTDNRLVSGSPLQRSFVGRVTNVMAGPNFGMAVSGASTLNVCAGQPVPPVTVNATAFSGFSSPVALSFPGLNAAVFPTATASPNPVTPSASPGSAITVNLTTAAAAPTGTYPITLEGTFGGPPSITRSAAFTVNVSQGLPTAAALTAPADNATSVATMPTFTWAAVAGANSYLVEVASDAAFTNIVASGTVTSPSFTPASALNTTTTYYWRVKASNACGDGAYSPVFRFTTGAIICFNGSVAIPDNNATGANADVTVAAAGTITDLNVSVKITHTYPGDLDLILVHQASNTSLTLGTRLGGSSCGMDNIDVSFDDEAPGTITCATTSPGITGTVRPANPLTAFDGLNLASGWRLTAIDRAGQDTGNITQYCLIPTLLVDQIFKNGFEQ
ncbi:proprotein convertase P-domain-containing protein [Tahibacter caeni]|uniref:proprotein convertase P-domain-containing protein n=1 Tax=Tahibacter caeni TaxID=1453545 RepID=UPI002147DF98|nr:proprotein convertase P-domain-containing protein [Tahibacter caeni]